VVTIRSISEKLFSAQVLPYYLHLLDKVQGAAHFDISEANALSLHEKLCNQLPGYLVPRLVRELGGMPTKQLISSLAGSGERVHKTCETPADR